MKQTKGPGKSYRKGLTLVQLMDKFPDEAAAERWFIENRWPEGIACPFCGSLDDPVERKDRKPQPYHCRACRKDFSVKTNTLMHNSKLPLRTWALAFYLVTTSLKGVSSMKLHRDLGITQKSAWHLAHRIRETWEDHQGMFVGPVEFDETYIGGKEKNKHAWKKQRAGRGPVGKAAIVGAWERETGKIALKHVRSTDKATLHEFVQKTTSGWAIVITDEAPGYRNLEKRVHLTVRHSAGEYVNALASTNGVESVWALVKRAIYGTFHHISEKHLGRYVREFAGRHNDRTEDTEEQMRRMVRGVSGKRLRYDDLTGRNGIAKAATS